MLSYSKETLNFKEACLYTGLSSSQLYKLLNGKEVPHYKPHGKLIFFNRKELDSWLCSNKRSIELAMEI
ncbi:MULTISPECIES: helix-turn-helix domain-containing protein [Bacteroidales]|jgi:excisionase family DNA binding protein|nr:MULTISPECIES: helix-turn-helix domain-containing protein [Bacteroidales]